MKKVSDANGLNIGAKAPIFNAMDADSNIFSLQKALKSSPVVLIFYRGFWCPYCNRHLKQIQDSLQLIVEKGAKVIAISPEKPEYLGKMKKKTGVEFILLYDEDYKISDAFDVTFTPEKVQLLTYNVALNAKLKNTHSDSTQRLPIPATFIINQSGIIVWRQFNPDYKKRSTVKDILNNLSKLN
ncbi:MAG: AhpC/TSA family protein [Chlorobi bacterium]|nr:AhpC/TSA family protein [Chlorobiota bacterium]